MSLRTILNDRDATFVCDVHDCSHVHAAAIQVNGHDRPDGRCLRIEQGVDLGGVNQAVLLVYVGKQGRRTSLANRDRRGNRAHRCRDYCASLANAQRTQGNFKCIGPVGEAESV